jgi:membrane protein
MSIAVIYKMLPEVKLAWKDVWIGALGTAALFTVGKHLTEFIWE